MAQGFYEAHGGSVSATDRRRLGLRPWQDNPQRGSVGREEEVDELIQQRLAWWSASLRMFEVQETQRKFMDSSSIATVGPVVDRHADTGLNVLVHMRRLGTMWEVVEAAWLVDSCEVVKIVVSA